MIQRLRDWLRERRIAAMQAEMRRAARYTNPREFRALWAQLRDEINQRSPAQVARMERKRGLTP